MQKCSADSYPRFNKITKTPVCPEDSVELRKLLLDFIADFADWDNSTDTEYLAVARSLTVAAHDALEGINAFTLPTHINTETLNEAIKDSPRPLLVDPFAGGGSIPLEGLRCGSDAFASDLNPVAVLLNKVVLEYIPKYGQHLAVEVEKWGKWIKEQAEKELAEFYPQDEDGAIPIAYLWARTITCEGPGCGAEVPLMRSYWLAKKRKESVAVQIVPKPGEKRCDFAIIKNENGKWVYQDQPNKIFEKPKFDGTVARGSATCPCCGFTTPVASVRSQLKSRKGGANNARLFTVVTTHPRQKGRFYRLPTEHDLVTVRKAVEELERRKKAHADALSLVPEEPLPPPGTLGFRVQRYGMTRWNDLFSSRQLLALTTLVRLVNEIEDEATRTALAICIDRQADYLTSLVIWANTGEFIAHTFGRQALPIVWEWPECSLFQECSGNWSGAVDWVSRVIVSNSFEKSHVNIVQNTATKHPLPSESAQCFFTDPPYYDAVPYADLSDFFYVWLRRSLPGLFDEELSPKDDECIVDEVKAKDRTYFESAMGLAMQEGRRILAPSGIGCVVFAHKSTSGWEAQLQAMIDAGWTMTCSWPIDTERPGRLRSQNSAALASSVHLVCRPRENPDGSVRMDDIGDWRDVLAELPKRIHEWMPRLSAEGVVGADAIFACLGPTLEIYSRYSRVEKASGEVVTLKEYLEQVWAVVSKEALTMVFEGADTTGFEEDARLTAMLLWTLSTGNANGDGYTADDSGDEDDEKSSKIKSSGYTLEYDAARRIAQGLGAYLENLKTLVEVKGDKARLLSVSERTKALFSKEESDAPARKRKKKSPQLQLDFMQEIEKSEQESNWGQKSAPQLGKTTLDRLHQSMILFAAGRGEALKRFLVEDGVGRDQQYWKLAQAMSALYPANSDEKRWVDGVLARKKGLGF